MRELERPRSLGRVSGVRLATFFTLLPQKGGGFFSPTLGSRQPLEGYSQGSSRKHRDLAAHLSCPSSFSVLGSEVGVVLGLAASSKQSDSAMRGSQAEVTSSESTTLSVAG